MRRPYVWPVGGIENGLWQSAIKVRGRATISASFKDSNTTRRSTSSGCGSAGLGGKRNLAIGELALGHEDLTRFVILEPLRRAHKCVFAVLAPDSEPIDPRL